MDDKRTSKRQSDILSKVIDLSNKYNLPVSHMATLKDDGDSYIGVLWNHPDLMMELSIFDEDEVVFSLAEKLKNDGTKIAAFDCVENSEKLFKSLHEDGKRIVDSMNESAKMAMEDQVDFDDLFDSLDGDL